MRQGDLETGVPRGVGSGAAGRTADGTAENSGAVTGHPDSARRLGRGLASREGSGFFFFFLLLVYLVLEYGRPANPMGIPMLISILSLGGWLIRRDKRWSSQVTGFLVLAVVMVGGILMARNTYAAFWTVYGKLVLLLCICAPLVSLVTSIQRIRAWVYTFVTVALYVGGYALFHGGNGPSGSAGAQDENYVAAMMGMALPFAYFSIYAETRRAVKALLALSIVVFCGAIVVGFSRGGFLGLCAAGLYCLARSPRKLLGISLVAVIGVTVLVFAGPTYWDRLATMKDVDEGTADLRIEVWKMGMRMFAAHPVFGVGPGNFRWAVGDYQSTEQLARYGRRFGGSIVAHSMFVELLAELGIVGASVVLAILWYTGRDFMLVQRGAKRLSRRRTVVGDIDRLRCYSDAVVGSILSCLVTGAFLSLLDTSYPWLLIAFASGVTQVFRSYVVAQRAV